MTSNVPKALALIPDGNRRWAKGHGLSYAEGYARGVSKFIDFADWCAGYGIKNVSVWAFSTENFKRPSPEKNALFSIYQQVATDDSIIKRLHSNRTRFNIVGNVALLPKRLRDALRNVERETSCYKEKQINMLMAYGGKDDILHAANLAIEMALRRRISAVSEGLFRSMMFSAAIPDLDLIIRTSGEERTSGMMPWQSAYAELYFSKKYWPDFTRRDLALAIDDYGRRQRRFGR